MAIALHVGQQVKLSCAQPRAVGSVSASWSRWTRSFTQWAALSSARSRVHSNARNVTFVRKNLFRCVIRVAALRLLNTAIKYETNSWQAFLTNRKQEAKTTMVISISSRGPDKGSVLHELVKAALLSAHGNASVSAMNAVAAILNVHS